MKIGILGGTFDPIHVGHIEIAKQAILQNKVQKVIIIPSLIPPHKKGKDITNSDDRLKMLELAIQGIDNLEISTYEIEKKEISYSIDTVNYFVENNKNDSFYWLMGQDMLIYFDKWYHYREILNKIGLIAVIRGGYKHEEFDNCVKILKKEENAVIDVLNMKPIKISSSLIRDNINNEKSISGMVPKAVESYIYANGLYQTQVEGK